MKDRLSRWGVAPGIGKPLFRPDASQKTDEIKGRSEAGAFLLIAAILTFASHLAPAGSGQAPEMANQARKGGHSLGRSPNEYFLRTSGDRPYGVAFDNDRSMYMITAPPTGDGTLSKVISNGQVTKIVTLEGTFIGPGIDIDTLGNLYVTVGDKALRILPNHKTEVVADGFARCIDIKVDKGGNAYIADDTRGTVYRVSPSSVKTVVYRRVGSGSFVLTGLAFDRTYQNLYVRDGSRVVVLRISPDGAIAKPKIVVDKTSTFSLTVDNGDHLYASTADNIVSIDGNGRVRNLSPTPLKTPIGLAKGGKGFDENSLYVAVVDGIVRLPVGE